jgi:predicted nuclease of restriction endonuclease-like (RecB) superfamily
MSRVGFENWMRRNGKATGTINSYISSLNGISRHYSRNRRPRTDVFRLEAGDLDLLREIRIAYNRGGRFENIGDTGHGAYRASINEYVRYITGNNQEDVIDDQFINEEEGAENIDANDEQIRMTYENDLQNAIELQAEELFPGYRIFGNNEGIQYDINGKRIDLLLEHRTENKLLVVELKAGLADFRVFGQISMYIGPLSQRFPDKEISGIIIAGEIDDSLRYACLTSEKVKLKRYQMRINLEDI